MFMPMALNGQNGDTDAQIQMSSSLSLDFYDENLQKLHFINQQSPIEFWISHETFQIQPFKLINESSSSMFTTGFNLSGNHSIFIEIKPQNQTIKYMSLLKFGANPSLSNGFYDIINTHEQEPVYLIFVNMSQTSGFQGYVGITIIELNQTNFTDVFWLRIFLSSCYYTDPVSMTWLSDGLEILKDSNMTHAHCLTNHLTTFASGFIVVPDAIDFQNVWDNASFLQNPVIYLTVISLISV